MRHHTVKFLADEILADCSQNRQSAKINSPPKFPAIRYIEREPLVIKYVTVSGSAFHVRYTQRNQFVKRSLAVGNDNLLPVQTQSTKQNGRPRGFVHHVKNRLCYYFAIYPTNESCSQRCSRKIMLLRSLVKILLAIYNSKCY